MKRSQLIIRLPVLFILLLGALVAPITAHAQESDLISYQGVEIKPGDVIDFRGGWVTTTSVVVAGAIGRLTPVNPIKILTYGHTGLYLGIDPETGKRTFLDFTTIWEPKEPQMHFGGRILTEESFLTVNSNQHTSFDVFRLNDVSKLTSRKLLHEAQLISYPTIRFLGPNDCASAVAKVLSKTTGIPIDLISPDGFMLPPFQKLPALRDRSIDVQAALREVKALEAVDTRSAQLRNLVPQMVAARRVAHRTSLTLEEYAALSDARRQELLYAQLDYLRTLVGYTCSDPGDLGTLNDQGRVAGVSLAQKDLQAYVDGASAHMSGCEKQIYANIFANVGAASIQSLVGWGVTYRSEHNVRVDVKHFLDKIAEYCAEVVGAFASLADALELPSDGDSSPPSSNTSSGSDHSASSPNNWSTLNDLRGISASGGIWPQ